MPVRIGTSTPSTFKVGSSQVTKLYQGATLVWSTAAALSVSASHTSVSGYESRIAPAAANVNVTSISTVITASGGSGSYTYSWSRLSGSTAINVNGATSPNTPFNAVLGQNNTVTGVWRCTVSDGTSSAYVDVDVSLTYEVATE